MQGLRIGHFTNQTNGTGISVFLFEKGAIGSYVLCGSSPASHELAPLATDTSVQEVHGLVLTGGSAFGLFAAAGVMRYLVEHEIGLRLPHGVVPIVPAAAIYDLSYKRAIAPSEAEAYQACVDAKEHDHSSGRIGAGTGATVGKIVSGSQHMTGGIGRAEMTLPGDVNILAYAVVNAVGDVHDAEGNIVAGAVKPDGEFANAEKYILAGHDEEAFFRRSNTTLVAVFTNARFSKSELKRISKMAIAGLPLAISPVFTCFDGDILFSFSLGTLSASVLSVGTAAVHVVRLAILDAVKNAEVVS